MADAEAARKEAQYDGLMDEKKTINDRTRLRRNGTEKLHEHKENRDMAVLAAKKKATAEAKLDAIEQSISDVTSYMSKAEVDEKPKRQQHHALNHGYGASKKTKCTGKRSDRKQTKWKNYSCQQTGKKR